MKKTQPDPADLQETVDLPPTEREPTGGGNTRRDRPAHAAKETGEIPPEPATENSGELGFAIKNLADETLPAESQGGPGAT
jgi:hypothetical protein